MSAHSRRSPRETWGTQIGELNVRKSAGIAVGVLLALTGGGGFGQVQETAKAGERAQRPKPFSIFIPSR